jgi:hypothetical protein
VELADRDAQPERGPDLDDGVDSEAEQLAPCGSATGTLRVTISF